MRLALTSPSFKNTQMIPARFTCDGEDLSPELRWSGAPTGTGSFALFCEDPDAPGGDWAHWVLFDVPAGSSGVPEGVPPVERPAGGGTHGRNGWGRLGYGGPCPPRGIHRYFFVLCALDRRLDLPAGVTKSEVRRAGEKHVLAEALLMGRYRRR